MALLSARRTRNLILELLRRNQKLAKDRNNAKNPQMLETIDHEIKRWNEYIQIRDAVINANKARERQNLIANPGK